MFNDFFFTLFNYFRLFDPAVNLYHEDLYHEALYREALYHKALYHETLYHKALYHEALYHETLYHVAMVLAEGIILLVEVVMFEAVEEVHLA